MILPVSVRYLHKFRLTLFDAVFSLSFGTGVDMFQPPNGRKGLEGLRSCKGTWHARHLHMTKPSQVTFHGHHFRAIMGFIMNGLAPRYSVYRSSYMGYSDEPALNLLYSRSIIMVDEFNLFTSWFSLLALLDSIFQASS